MLVTVVHMGTPRSTGENYGCTWEILDARLTSLEATATCLETPMRRLGAPTTSLGAPKTSLGASWRTSGKSGSTPIHGEAVWQKHHLPQEFGLCAWIF
jgi:hypothetical protein